MVLEVWRRKSPLAGETPSNSQYTCSLYLHCIRWLGKGTDLFRKWHDAWVLIQITDRGSLIQMTGPWQSSEMMWQRVEWTQREKEKRAGEVTSLLGTGWMEELSTHGEGNR